MIDKFTKGKYAGMDYIGVGRVDYPYLCWCLTLEINRDIKMLIHNAMKELDAIEDDLPF